MLFALELRLERSIVVWGEEGADAGGGRGLEVGSWDSKWKCEVDCCGYERIVED